MEEWERVLKPIIQDLYIERNTTQTALIDKLKTEYGIKITGKQLTNHLKVWGFAKNATQSQRMAALNSDDALEKTGLKVTEAKKIRWKKERMRRNDPQNICAPEIFMIEAPKLDVPEIKAPKFDELVPKFGIENLDVKMEIDSEPFPWPFSWNYVDVQNSPGLTRLFSHLKIEIEEEFPEFEFSPSSAEHSKNTCSSGANSKLSDKEGPSGAGTLGNCTSLSRVTYASSPRTARQGFGASLQHGDFDFSRPPFSFPSPFNEVYFFPNSPITKHRKPKHLSAEQLDDWDSKLRHLNKFELLSLSNSKNLQMIRSFIGSCFASFPNPFARKAEFWCEQLLKNNYRGNPSTISKDRLYLAEAAYHKHQRQKAQVIIEDVEKDLTRLGISNDEVSIQSSFLRGRLSDRARDYKAGEKRFRDCLQQCLNTLGPSHEKTLDAMCRLSFPIQKRNYPQSEELLRTAIRIGEKNSVTLFGAMSRLAGELRWTHQHEGAVAIGKKTLEVLRGNIKKRVLTIQNNTRRCVRHSICSLLERGMVRKSIKVVREYTSTDIPIFVAMCGRIAKSCRAHQEIEMLVSLLKSCEEKQNLSSSWKLLVRLGSRQV